MRLYRITKASSPIVHSSSYTGERPWWTVHKILQRDETLQRTGVDVHGPGRWFTSDLEELKWYVNEYANNYQELGSIFVYVDVPDDIVENFSSLRLHKGEVENPHIKPEHLKDLFNGTYGISGLTTEYYLPEEWASKAKIAATVPELIASNYDFAKFLEHKALSKFFFVRLSEKKTLIEGLPALPPPDIQKELNRPGIVQQVKDDKPDWVKNPSSDTEVGAVGVEKPNLMDDIMLQRRIASALARRELLKQIYKDAGVETSAQNLDIEWAKVAEFYTDPKTKNLYCHVLMPRAQYNKLVNLVKMQNQPKK